MNPNISIPIALSLIAFFIADERSVLIRTLADQGIKSKDRSSVRNRLSQLGKNQDLDYENFRLAQMTLIAASTFLCLAALLFSLISFFVFLLFAAIAAGAIIFFTERNLTRRCLLKREDIESEFPSIVELLTLSVAAGESPAASFKRISLRAHGYLAKEFSQVVDEIERGIPLNSALDSMSRRLDSDSIRRFVDSIVISISRGTPLIDTLTHSVREARNQERIKLLKAAGKSEISMMIPVVFLILPISILFALFPSLTSLNLFNS